MQFLSLVEAISNNLTPQNIESVVALLERLVEVGQSIEKHMEKK